VCRGVELSREQVCSWYENRACEIEQLSGQVDGALQLVKLAIDKSVEVCYNKFSLTMNNLYCLVNRGTLCVNNLPRVVT